MAFVTYKSQHTIFWWKIQF